MFVKQVIIAIVTLSLPFNSSQLTAFAKDIEYFGMDEARDVASRAHEAASSAAGAASDWASDAADRASDWASDAASRAAEAAGNAANSAAGAVKDLGFCHGEGESCIGNPMNSMDNDNELHTCCNGFNCGVTMTCVKEKPDQIRAWKEAFNAIPIKLARDIPSHCRLQNYEVALNSFSNPSSHFFLTAKASGEVKSDHKKCPKTLAFASIDGHKASYLIPNAKKVNGDVYSLSLGKASLEEIIQAESSVEAVHDSKYDLTKNSCAHYAQRIWRALKFDETTKLANFLIENLLRNNGLVNYAGNTLQQGGLRVLTNHALGEGKFEKYVRNTVLGQLNIQ